MRIARYIVSKSDLGKTLDAYLRFYDISSADIVERTECSASCLSAYRAEDSRAIPMKRFLQVVTVMDDLDYKVKPGTRMIKAAINQIAVYLSIRQEYKISRSRKPSDHYVQLYGTGKMRGYAEDNGIKASDLARVSGIEPQRLSDYWLKIPEDLYAHRCLPLIAAIDARSKYGPVGSELLEFMLDQASYRAGIIEASYKVKVDYALKRVA